MNLLTDITPVGVDGELLVEATNLPTVYTPFNEESAQVSMDGRRCHIALPKGCAYALLRFPFRR